MIKPHIWIDADSCPSLIRNYTVCRANALLLSISFVANETIPLGESIRYISEDSASSSKKLLINKSSSFEMIVCDATPDAADNYIANHAEKYDMIITRDIPLASRLVQNDFCVLNDRGTVYTKESVTRRLTDRNYNLQLAKIGLGSKGKRVYSKADFNSFVRCFNKEIMRLIRDASLSI